MSRRTKSLPVAANDRARELLRQIVADAGGQMAAAQLLGVKQPQVSEVLTQTSGVGAKLLAGIIRLRPEFATELAGLVPPEEPDVVTFMPPPEVAGLATKILRKRGWDEDEVAAAAKRVRFLTLEEATDPVCVADTWEAPLLGPPDRQRPGRAPR
jgi:hypothetical protein